MQIVLSDANESEGPHPKGMIRFGLVPEVVNQKRYNNFDAMMQLPHLDSFVLSSNNQVTKTLSVQQHVLSTLELDLASSARREARPIAILANCGYRHPKEGAPFDLAYMTVEVDIECHGTAFGLI